MIRSILERLFLISISLLICELTLYGINFQLYGIEVPEHLTPRYYQHDSVLGWVTKPGTYRYYESGRKIKITILPGSIRKGSEVRNFSHPPIAFFGGSYVEGWGLDDSEHFPALLAKHVPEHEMLNFGVAKHGTYQAYLRMESALEQRNDMGTLIYLFNDFHERRNIGAPIWLGYKTPNAQLVETKHPFVVLDQNGSLTATSITELTPWTTSGTFRISALLNNVYNEFLFLPQTRDRKVVTEKLLIKMRDLTKTAGKNFIVILYQLSDANRESYTRFFTENDIQTVDCSFSEMLSSEFTILNGHPNTRANVRIANCLSTSLPQIFSTPE